MKYHAAQVLALATMASAFPHPQFSFPSFRMPSFPTGGLGSGTGTGGGLTGGSGGLTGGSGGLTGGSGGLTGGSGGLTGGSGFSMPGGFSGGGFGGASTENGVVDKKGCTDMTVIFARGTGETGNVGSVAGPPMFKAIRSKLGADRVTVQGVDYAASAAGNASQGGDGGAKMAALVKQALSQCPDTKIILSGYSQGGMVVHRAMTQGISASQVSGAVLFGDPNKRSAVGNLPKDKVKQFCGTSDQICGGGGDGGATGGHISYGSSADAAATFAIQAAGLA